MIAARRARVAPSRRLARQKKLSIRRRNGVSHGSWWQAATASLAKQTAWRAIETQRNIKNSRRTSVDAAKEISESQQRQTKAKMSAKSGDKAKAA
jgi:hypothetical protein